MNVPAILERSRSGNGGHVWIFFEAAIEASRARQLGTAILTKCLSKRHEIGFESYDRLFPNQDTMPKGGFGNLIALPLQGQSKLQGNSIFLDRQFIPYEDQWKFLSSVLKMTTDQVESTILDIEKSTGILPVKLSVLEEREPWKDVSDQEKRSSNIEGALPSTIKVIESNSFYVEKSGLPTTFMQKLMTIAAFQNPEFYKAQSMRLSTYGKPRIISCAENSPTYIILPRGCKEELIDLFNEHNITLIWEEQREKGKTIKINFIGELTELQKTAVNELIKHDNGVLSATTAFGKTVVASWMIVERKVNTLILVHRRHLMDQWKERLGSFLNITPNSIGTIGGGKEKRTGYIDIGVIQSLNVKGQIKDFIAEYGHIVVDECHHISAYSFEQVMKKAKAKYVLGLTATPVRKDGHHPIVMMQCGPIRFKVDAKKQALNRPFAHIVVPRYTSFTISTNKENLTIQEIYSQLVEDKARNDLIFDDILLALEAGRTPILLSERTNHVEYFEKRLKNFAKNVIVLRGGLGSKQRKEVYEKIANIPDNEERVLIATGRYIGEGFDDARLDTLFLALPISWKGTLQQYAGRLHRLHHSKNEVKIYDYVDKNVPVLEKMYHKRLKGYQMLGYNVGGKGEVGAIRPLF
ncbi:Type III restriction protein res subunit [Heliorestis convoluta]|uniref:Type III restriction protein res subunit n=1 Tax=Heliorestis convoluta TaxID=356322 RepID=A0A5Q2N4M7_9FIRM|nr:Type III restriction protein res subunit [Heliorestis convoluta]